MIIGIFGSAFNPPTKGHEDAIKQALKYCNEVWLVPSYKHGFNKNMILIDDRINMLEKFLDNIDNNNIKICNIEKEIDEKLNKEHVYTYDLLIFLKNKYKNYNFKFICGPDNAVKETWSKFYKYDLIDKEFGKIVVKDTINIRSTMVREKIKTNDYKNLNKYIHENVKEYIINNNLYI